MLETSIRYAQMSVKEITISASFVETRSNGPLKAVGFLCAPLYLRDSVVKYDSCPTTELQKQRDAQR